MSLLITTGALALRNLLRHRGRTLSTLFAIVMGLWALTLLDGFITSTLDHLRETEVHSGTGHLQVFRSTQAEDQAKGNPLPYLFDDPGAVERRLRSLPSVSEVMPVLAFSAVIAAGDKTQTVQVTAAPLASSRRLLTARTIVAGTDLALDETGRVLLGAGLAKRLGVAPGDTLQLYSLSQGGGINTNSYTVAGLTSSQIKEIDDIAVAMSLPDAQALMNVTSVAQLVVFLHRWQDTSAVVRQLASMGMAAQSWDQLSYSYQWAATMYQLILTVARIVILIVALFSISGTLTLSVLDRYRELGTLRALGTKRRQLRELLALEGLFLGLGGTLVGSLVGLVAAALINAAGGLTLPAQPGMSVDTVTVLFTPRLVTLSQNMVAIVVASVLAALTPAALAHRKSTAELLRSY